MNARVSTAAAAALIVLLTALAVGPHAQPEFDPSQYVVVGDMWLDRDRVVTGPGEPGGPDRPLSFLEGLSWPGGAVPVAFAATVTPAQRAQLFAACTQWSRAANVRCFARTTETAYVSVTDQALGCSALVGYGAGVRALSLGPGCWNDRTVQHELGHSLGLMHEHQRSDRDQYLTVDASNVTPGTESAFAVVTPSQNVGPYDFASVMHYTFSSFARDGSRPVLIPKPGYARHRFSMGEGEPTQPYFSYGGGVSRPSAGDRAGIRARYGASPSYVGEPLNLRVAAAAGNTVTLAWTAPAGPPVRGYTLRAYAPPTGPVGAIGAFATVPLGPAVTSVTAAVPSAAYMLDLTATGDLGESAPSNPLMFLMPGGTPFVPPTYPVLQSSIANGAITLSWTSGDATPPPTYILEAGPADGPMQRFAVGATQTITAPMPAGIPLRITVEAHVPYSYQRSNTIRAQLGGLAAPVLAPPAVSGSSVILSWSPVAGATSYLVRARLTADGPPLGELPVTGTAVSLPGVPPGFYNLWILAVGGGLRSDESNGWQVRVP